MSRQIQRNIYRNKVVFATVLCFTASIAYAGAWTQKSGKGLFVQNMSYYFADRFFDNSGRKSPLDDYQKYELNPYIEYGLYDDVTIGSNIFLYQTSQKNSATNTKYTNWGLGDSEFFLRYRLRQNQGLVFSVEPMLKIPSPEKNNVLPRIGSDNIDTGLTFSAGYGFQAWKLNHYINADIGYRHRFGEATDQLKFSVTAGLSVSNDTMITSQIFITKRTGSRNQEIFTQSSGDNYDLSKLQLSAIHKINDDISLQTGIFKDISGKNTGSGKGISFAIFKEF